MNEGSGPAARPAWVPLERRPKIGFVFRLMVALVFTGATVGYFVWRQDKPPDNPGGPIRSMGGWCVFWEWIALCPGPALGTWGWFNAFLFLWKRLKQRIGEPPPAEEHSANLPINRVKNAVVVIICLILLGLIAVYIATHPAHYGKQTLVTGSLIVMSLPLIFGMVPEVRAEAGRWLRWLIGRRRDK